MPIPFPPGFVPRPCPSDAIKPPSPVPPDGSIHLTKSGTHPSDQPPPPPPLSGDRIPGPKYETPPAPPASPHRSDAPERPKPLMILRLKPGITIPEDQRDRLLSMSEQIGKALFSGGGLILDDSLVEPLVLIYGGQVIWFDGYEEWDPPEITGGNKPELPPRPARQPEQDRETW